MYGRTAAFDAAVVNSHKIATRCEIYQDGQYVQNLDITDGNITIDDVAIHRRATVDLTDTEGTLVPATARDLLAPVGSEVRLFRGITFFDGTTELLPQGVFGISDVRIDDSGQGLHIRLDVFDRARKVQRAKFPADYLISPGTNYIEAITQILVERFPAIEYNFPTTTRTTPNLMFEAGDDPWAATQAMANSMGMDLFFDPNGIAVMMPVALENLSAEWTYAEGASSMLLYTNRRLQDEQTYNHIIMTGESTANTIPVRAEAYDANPYSPTYRYGDYGDVVLFESSSFITTTSQAQDAARRKLAKTLGIIESLQIQSIVHPAHEIGDAVQVTRAKSKINSVYVLDKITMPMVHDRPLSASVRQMTLTV